MSIPNRMCVNQRNLQKKREIPLVYAYFLDLGNSFTLIYFLFLYFNDTGFKIFVIQITVVLVESFAKIDGVIHTQ